MGHIKKVHSEMFSTGSLSGAQTTAKSQESRKFKNRETSTNGRLSQDKQELIDNTLCKLIASRTISPSVVEDELFQTFVELLNPRLETILITFLKLIINCSEFFFSPTITCVKIKMRIMLNLTSLIERINFIFNKHDKFNFQLLNQFLKKNINWMYPCRYKIPSQDAIMRSLEDLPTTVFIDHDA